MEVCAEIALDVLRQVESVSDTYEKTYNEWKAQTAKLCYIYEYVLDVKTTTLNRLNVLILVITASTTLIAASQFGIEDKQGMLAVQVLLMISAFVATVLSGVVSTLGMNEDINEIHRYLDSLEHFHIAMASDDFLPDEIRTDRATFVKANRDRWLHAIRNAPRISETLHNKASNMYLKFNTNV